MKNMGHEGGEQIASSTPILDSILRKLPPLKLELKLSTTLSVVEWAKERLIEKLENGSLTQTDIEKELSGLPDVGGIEDGKASIVDAIRYNLPLHLQYNIKELPIE